MSSDNIRHAERCSNTEEMDSRAGSGSNNHRILVLPLVRG